MVKAKYAGRAEEFDLADIRKMESATLVYDRNGELVGKFFLQNRIPISGDEIPEIMRQAVVAAEDNRFYEHDGVDYLGILRAALKNYRSGRIRQGASTVTQQLARNSFELRERTYERKLVEIFLANRIEKNFSKREIMDLYLNRVYFGSGLYGVEAAARGYFGVPAKELTVGQCAMLAGLLKSPNGLSPWNNPDGARRARDFVLERMKDLGFLSSADAKREQDSILVTRRRTNPHKVSYAVDYVRQQAIATLGYERAMNGGFSVYTTLDMNMQRAAEIALRTELNRAEKKEGYDHETYEDFAKKFKPFDDMLRTGGFPKTPPPIPEYLQGAVIAFDNTTGGILTLVGGREFKHSEYNRATQGRRSAGTVFTPLVYAAACEKGIFPGDLVQDAALDNRYVGIGGTTGILGEWGVERRDNEYEGNIPAREALAEGKNAAMVRLGWEAGLSSVKDFAKRAGIASSLRNFSNTFLGTSEVGLAELTLAFSTFANSGVRPAKPYIIDRIVDGDGKEIFKAKPKVVPVTSDAVAYQTHVALEDALRIGTGAAATSRFGLGDFPAAGKSGTAYNFTDAYFIGYTRPVTCGVWVGFDKPSRIYRGAFGNDLALPIWTSVMNASTKDFPPVEFPRPESVVPVSVCRSSGLLETGRCEEDVIDPQTGEKRREKTSYIEFASKEHKPTIACDVHGTGLRLYEKEPEESEWPRAASAVDLALIRPVAVSAPALVGLNDVYRSVKPAAFRMKEEDIPVAKALPVNEQVAEAAMIEGEAAQAVQVAGPVPTGPQEVRKAEAVKPLDVPADTAAIPIEAPKPIQF